MYKHFDASFFSANRKRLRKLFAGTAPIVVTAHGMLQRSSDTTYPFRQDSNFWYLTGIPNPDIILVMDKDTEYLIVPERESVMEVFDGKVDGDTLRNISGVETVMSAKDGWRKLYGRARRVKHIATPAALESYVDFYDFYSNPARARLAEQLREANPKLELLNLQPHFRQMRVIKQQCELSALQEAIDITIDALELIKGKKYNYEYEYEADVTAHFRRNGAAGHGYSPIAAAGKHACTLHHVSNNGKVGPKQLLLFDVGAEVENYTADISRTYAVTAPTKRQKAVFEAVKQSQDYGFSLIKPGASIRENEKLIEQFIGEKLRELGLIRTITKEEVRKYYPHAMSHYLGLDAHDAGDYDRPLAPGMVLTVEPGIYIPEEGIGVRIEDDVLVTESGSKNLSRRLPRELA